MDASGRDVVVLAPACGSAGFGDPVAGGVGDLEQGAHFFQNLWKGGALIFVIVESQPVDIMGFCVYAVWVVVFPNDENSLFFGDMELVEVEEIFDCSECVAREFAGDFWKRGVIGKDEVCGVVGLVEGFGEQDDDFIEGFVLADDFRMGFQCEFFFAQCGYPSFGADRYLGGVCGGQGGQEGCNQEDRRAHFCFGSFFVSHYAWR